MITVDCEGSGFRVERLGVGLSGLWFTKGLKLGVGVSGVWSLAASQRMREPPPKGFGEKPGLSEFRFSGFRFKGFGQDLNPSIRHAERLGG